MDTSATSSGTTQASTMTGNTRLTGASAPAETPLIGKGKAAVPQKPLSDRTNGPERPAEEDQEDPEAGAEQEADSDSFTPTQCLFCNTTSPDFGSNLTHMGKSHSLLIPTSIDNGSLALAVDPVTLVRYMHLVISTYHECLLCHTQRQGAHAVRQHMTGKGHCRIDLEDSGSEFRDFYESAGAAGAGGDGDSDSDSGSSAGEDASEAEGSPRAGAEPPLRLREGTLLLASGKLLSNRSAPGPRHHRPLSETQKPTRRGALPAAASHPSEDSPGPPPPPPAGPSPADTTADTGRALTRLERRAEASGRSSLAVAMAQMSVGDRAALAHLPAAEQRAVVLRQFKQQDRARHEARVYWSKVELRGNRTIKK
ncbi:hypothetical protein KVR01_007786 [Diaporthe batatas]|uniref:uncharacterized protein n=1 Tax=Diaporthe batatas TaxID=748121 RepID=UPI001D056FFE|nr:uncharacterized protein KVR01_007786 [Diaporthe batatas]KAG8162021.1 hypothetical protein KVR01_007786 [Diaporthe batatas]